MVGNRGAWYAAVHEVAKIQTQLSDATTATPTGSLLWNEECWHFPFREVFSSVKSLKILLRAYLEVEPKPFPRPNYCFLAVSPCVWIPFFSPLATIGICPLELRESHGVQSQLHISKKWGTWKGFQAKEPHRVLLGLITSSLLELITEGRILSISLWLYKDTYTHTNF